MRFGFAGHDTTILLGDYGDGVLDRSCPPLQQGAMVNESNTWNAPLK